eukprot:5918512-Alexandrium_andersonii.AAC.1
MVSGVERVHPSELLFNVHMALVLQKRGPPGGQSGERPGRTGKDFPSLEDRSRWTRRPADPGTSA